jgi:hypothetical protein
MEIKTFAAALLFGIAIHSQALAQAGSALDIIKANDAQRKSLTEKVELTMKLINEKGKERVRTIAQATATDKDGNQKILLRFLTPADVKGTGFLTHEASSRDDDQWLFLPALKKVRRISAADQSDSFMGSDFSYEDIGSEEMDQNAYKLLREEKLDGQDCYVVEAVPSGAKGKSSSGYSKRELWIRKDNSVLARGRFYDKSGSLLKTLEAADIKQVEGTSKWRANRMEMANPNTGHKTVLTFGKFEIDKALVEDVFSLRNLEAANQL